MSRNSSDFFRGKRKKASGAFIASIIVLSLVAFVILLFYGLQKYIVITNNGLTLDIPFLTGSSGITVSENGQAPAQSFAPVTAELVVGEADYSNVTATAGEDLGEMRAIFVPAADINADSLASYADRLSAGNALVLELKPVSGILSYVSSTEISVNYGTSGSTDLAASIAALKEKGVYLVASLSCCVDNTLAVRYPATALKTSDGTAFSDSVGSWLDPYNADVRSYTIALCKELAGMGFDEILLTNLYQPQAENTTFTYSGSTSAAPSAITAVSGFAISVSRGLEGSSAALSVRCDSSTAMQSGTDAANGQNVELFFKIFDRIYYPTSNDAAQSAVTSAQNYVELGDVNLRLVPVCTGSQPDTTCWVLRDSA